MQNVFFFLNISIAYVNNFVMNGCFSHKIKVNSSKINSEFINGLSEIDLKEET